MNIWAIADLHLSFGVPDKTMEVFGSKWERYTEKMESHWRRLVKSDDLILIAGDISWAMTVQEVYADLEWIDSLPGIKVLIKGNHDYWWSSLTKIKKILPPSIHLIQNNSFSYQDVSIGGTRLWDTDEYNFNSYIEYQKRDEKEKEPQTTDTQKIFNRELERLELSLKTLNPNAALRIAMTHYPPIGAQLYPSKASALLEKYGVALCVFGHLHNVKSGALPFGTTRGVSYFLTSCDYINYQPCLVSARGLAASFGADF